MTISLFTKKLVRSSSLSGSSAGKVIKNVLENSGTWHLLKDCNPNETLQFFYMKNLSIFESIPFNDDLFLGTKASYRCDDNPKGCVVKLTIQSDVCDLLVGFWGGSLTIYLIIWVVGIIGFDSEWNSSFFGFIFCWVIFPFGILYAKLLADFKHLKNEFTEIIVLKEKYHRQSRINDNLI